MGFAGRDAGGPGTGPGAGPESAGDGRVNGCIAVSSRIRLARNLASYTFPPILDNAGAESVAAEVRAAAEKIMGAMGSETEYRGVDSMGTLSGQAMVEGRIISANLLEGSIERGVILSMGGKVSIMVNEEDHLRLQCILPGMDLGRAWELADAIDSGLEGLLGYAVDKEFGYLTSCPTNLGTGLRASIMLHLPVLVMTGLIQKVLEACGKMGVMVRGTYGENSNANGNMFQFSNQVSLGHTEGEIISGVTSVTQQVMNQEAAMRGELHKKDPVKVEDRVHRSLGLLKHARILSSDEAFRLLSDVILGSDMGILRNVCVGGLFELMTKIQPASLQQNLGKPLDPGERDVRRAELFRGEFAGV